MFYTINIQQLFLQMKSSLRTFPNKSQVKLRLLLILTSFETGRPDAFRVLIEVSPGSSPISPRYQRTDRDGNFTFPGTCLSAHGIEWAIILSRFLLPASSYTEFIFTKDSLVPSATTNTQRYDNNLTLCTPNPGRTTTVVEAVAFHALVGMGFPTQGEGWCLRWRKREYSICDLQ